MSARSSAVGTLAFMVFGTYILTFLLTMLIGAPGGIFFSSGMEMGFMLMAIPNGIMNIFNPISNTIAVLSLSLWGSPVGHNPYMGALIGIVYPVFCMVVYFAVGVALFKKTVKRIGELPS